MTREEKSQATRIALLEATIEALSEEGFSGATTSLIVQKAGVSRGAQVHHFPTKRDLILGTLEYVLDKETETFTRALSSLEEPTLKAAVEKLWQILQGPSYRAVLELIVAARTDPSLFEEVRVLFKDFIDRARNVFLSFFPSFSDSPGTAYTVAFAFGALQGAAIMKDLGLEDLAEGSAAILRTLAELLWEQNKGGARR